MAAPPLQTNPDNIFNPEMLEFLRENPCCEGFTDEQTKNLASIFCNINTALGQCINNHPNVPLDNLLFKVFMKLPMLEKRGALWRWKYKEKFEIEGFIDIYKEYKKCRDKGNGDNDLWEKQCPDTPILKEPNPCPSWASKVSETMNKIARQIQVTVNDSCNKRWSNPEIDLMAPNPLPIQFGTVCKPLASFNPPSYTNPGIFLIR